MILAFPVPMPALPTGLPVRKLIQHAISFDFMKNWKNIFKKKYSSSCSHGIAENVHEGRISHGKIYLDQFDSNAETGADKDREYICARCREVFHEQ